MTTVHGGCAISAEAGLGLLFLSAFIASTIFPGGSEAVLVALALQNTHTDGVLLAVATAGNTLGSMTTWAMGRLLARRFPGRTPDPKYDKALARLRRGGSPVLLLAWLPLAGDALCFAAGWLGIQAGKAAAWIALGKAARYAVLLMLT